MVRIQKTNSLRRTHPGRNWGSYARTAYNVANAVNKGYQLYKNVTGGKVRDQTLTTQYDTKLQYRYKRMPYKKRKAWSKFTKKVQAAGDRLIGQRTVLLNEYIVLDQTLGLGEQTYGFVHLNGANGVNVASREIGARDLRQLYTNDPEFSIQSKAIIRNAIIDITMKNVMSVGTIEVDVYVLKYGWSEQPMVNAYTAFSTYTSNPIQSGTSLITMDQRGATPFDMPDVLSILRAKIISKRKYLLSAGQCATYQHRDNRNHMVKGYELDANSLRGSTDFNNKNTMSFLVVSKNTDVTATQAALQVSATTNYRYKILPASVNKPRVNLLAG
jgi:hypothetical protein